MNTPTCPINYCSGRPVTFLLSTMFMLTLFLKEHWHKHEIKYWIANVIIHSSSQNKVVIGALQSCVFVLTDNNGCMEAIRAPVKEKLYVLPVLVTICGISVYKHSSGILRLPVLPGIFYFSSANHRLCLTRSVSYFMASSSTVGQTVVGDFFMGHVCLLACVETTIFGLTAWKRQRSLVCYSWKSLEGM